MITLHLPQTHFICYSSPPQNNAGKILSNCTVSKASKLDAIFLEANRISGKKLLRLKFNDKNLFLSSARKTTVADLGVNQNDSFIIMSTYSNTEKSSIPKVNTSNSSTVSKPKLVQRKPSQHKPSQKRSPWAGVIDTESKEYYRRQHSAMMEPVFKEAEPTFQEIRKKLNDLNLKRTKPKIRSIIATRKPLEAIDHNIDSAESSASKAGKWSFIVNVGEVDNLYKTSKHSKLLPPHPTSTLDLHGFSKKQALNALSNNLPSWIDKAMKSDHPYVIQVEIICGKGCQVLCEVVEKWIKSERQVANAPKRKL